jgi:tol-pal system protein YbgF
MPIPRAMKTIITAAGLVAVGLSSIPAVAQQLSRDTVLELVSQMEAMQAELRQLRNQTELQGHELERLSATQRELLHDLDRRLTNVERGAATQTMRAQPTESTQTQTATIQTPTTTPSTRPTATPEEQQQYDAAFNLLKQGLYSRASQAFRAFIQKYPSSPLAGNAQYWTAEANYVIRNFGLALKEFNRVVKEYPESPKVADALLKIGYSYYEIGTWEKARRALTDVVARFPNTTVAKLAQIRLNKMDEEGR